MYKMGGVLIIQNIFEKLDTKNLVKTFHNIKFQRFRIFNIKIGK